MRSPLLLLLAAVPCLLTSGAQAQAISAEDRTRDALRQTTLQLRQVQDENADLRAKLQAQEQRLAQLTQNATAVKAPAPVDASELIKLRRSLEAQSADAAALRQQLDDAQKALSQWQQGYQQAADLARGRDAEAKKYETLYHDTDARAQSCEQKNAELFKLGNELLDRYKNKGVWESLGDDEPFTRIHRVQLEKLAQDYHARLLDQKAEPPAGVTGEGH
ncbi:MAG: hypothetical protein OSA97_11950 [Nevskia sp.]|nr:hypothetical protein [Nevskia sp.]